MRCECPEPTFDLHCRSVAGVWSGIAGLVFALVSAFVCADETLLSERFVNASPERGEEVFRVCRACHTINQSARHGVGPDLWGVVGRMVAADTDYTRYTEAMSSVGGSWTPEGLDRYLRQPMAEIAGTAMVFPGVQSANDRADLILYLNRNSDSPLDLGAGIGTAGVSGEASMGEVETPDLGVLVVTEGARETYAYCTACHSERLVAQQGLTRDGWEEVLEFMVEEQGMLPVEGADRERVLTYLSTHYGIDRPNFPKN